MTPRPSDAAGPAGPRGSGPPRGRSGPARPPEIDPARLAALELLTAVRVRDAYANLALPAILRRHRLRDRDAALATELGYGTLRARGLLDAVIDACTDRPLARVEPTAARRPAPGRLPAAAHPGAAARRRRHHRRAGAGGRGQPRGRVRQRRAAQGGRARRGGLGASSSRRTPMEDPLGPRGASPTPTRGGSRRRSPTRSAPGAATSSTRRWPPTTPARTVHLLARPGEITAEELAARHRRQPSAVLALRRAPRAGSGDVGRPRRRGRGPRRRAGRGQPAGGARAHPGAAVGGRHGPLARPVRGPRRQVGAARRARSPIDGGHARRRGAQPSTAPSWCGAPSTACPVDVHTADGRDAAAARRGAYDRVLVDAPCTGLGALRRRPGGALAPPPRRRADADQAAARAAHRGAAARPPRRRGRLRHVLAAPRRDPRRAAPTVLRHSHARRGAARRPAAACPACRDLGDGPDACSCGRTGTAPTRCSCLLRRTAEPRRPAPRRTGRRTGAASLLACLR